MLNLGQRFAEYGITGGLFIFLQFVLLISFYPDLPKAGMGVFDPTFPICLRLFRQQLAAW
jgi:hypothetical protein